MEQQRQRCSYHIRQWNGNRKKVQKAKSIRSSYSSATTMNRLAKKKKYYVRVRGYVTYNGKNYYGAWSKVKAIRTKK